MAKKTERRKKATRHEEPAENEESEMSNGEEETEATAKAELTMGNSAPGSTERSQSRSRNRAESEKIVVVELENAEFESQVRGLLTGKGKLIDRIEDVLDDLFTAGTLRADAQTVVFVVPEVAHLPLGGLGSDDEDRPAD